MDVPVSPGRRQALAGGYFLLIKGLPPGIYRFKFGGKGLNNFYTASMYDIKILPEGTTNAKDISSLAAKRRGLSLRQYYP